MSPCDVVSSGPGDNNKPASLSPILSSCGRPPVKSTGTSPRRELRQQLIETRGQNRLRTPALPVAPWLLI
ncbi:hypothetical protein EYF80_021605 [Liparis tanakae]|uniref:Uncharacterized protein n=1 Tax=Liparis tanakae TaxID=230148 RepID=A0A4Z2HTD3_9TELE|nr:hypothetical protein EYF80_021605 [Liparis tanakae]